MKVISPFGPKIAKLRFPSRLIKMINSEVDKIISKKKLIKKFDYSKKLVGQVKQELQLPRIFIKKNLEKTISNEVKKYIKKSSGKNINSIKIKNFWVVRQFNNEYNPIHWHSGHISGAGFLKVPKTLGSHLQDKGNKKYSGGNLNLIHGSNMFLSRSMYEIKPEVGDFYFFPHYVMHTVYPFKGTEEERRSISFNATIDERIYDVYGKY